MKKALKIVSVVVIALLGYTATAQITPPVFDENVDDVPIEMLIGIGLVFGLIYGAKRKLNF